MIILEPHADDAFLCMGGHIERWRKAGVPVTIVTWFSATRERGTEAERYARAVKADWMGLGGDEDGASKRKVAGALLRDWASRMHLGNEQVYLPLALTHHEHRDCRRIMEEFEWKRPLRYYLDQPYATFLKNQKVASARLEGMRVVSYFAPHGRKYRHIPIFKDQHGFFWLNPAAKLMRTMELTVEV